MTPYEAHKIFQSALNRGQLKPADTCEICGAEGWGYIRNIVGHHWRGYDYPTDVWWICKQCNSRLSNKHDGSLATPQDAKRYLDALPSTNAVYVASIRTSTANIERLKNIAAQRNITMVALFTEITLAWLDEQG